MALSLRFVLAEHNATLRRIIVQDAARAADRRAQEANAVADRLRLLQQRRGVDQTVLAAAVAEQAARTRLSEQARRNAAAARAALADHRPDPV
jgi:hypothetical protein